MQTEYTSSHEDVYNNIKFENISGKLSFDVETTTCQLNQVAFQVYPATSEYVSCVQRTLVKKRYR